MFHCISISHLLCPALQLSHQTNFGWMTEEANKLNECKSHFCSPLSFHVPF